MTKPESNTDVLAAIVAAYATRQDVTADDIVTLVGKLRQEFGEEPSASAGAFTPAPRHASPAIPIENAVTHDKVFCLCCGKGFKMLKRHLGAEHGLTESAYRAMFGLAEDFPLVAPSYSERKASYARRVGFGKYDRREARPEKSTAPEKLKIS
ncbi:MAG: MucR family transcriptional regulator [Roseinatronobacter sp.]